MMMLPSGGYKKSINTSDAGNRLETPKVSLSFPVLKTLSLGLADPRKQTPRQCRVQDVY